MRRFSKKTQLCKDEWDSAAFQEFPALGLREFFDCVAEHSARHCGGTIFQPGFQPRHIPFAGFPQEPANSFLKQVVKRLSGGLQKDLGNSISVIQLPCPDKSHSADNAYTPFPNRSPVSGKFIKNAAVFIHKPLSQKRIAAQVHQVPIVDIGRMR